MNKSILDEEYSVTCLDPPNLLGTPVWNISDFGCETTTSTIQPYQHLPSKKLLPKLLGLLGMYYKCLLYARLCVTFPLNSFGYQLW